MGIEHTQVPVGTHRREVTIWTVGYSGDKLMTLPGAFQSLFNDKIGLNFSTGACKSRAVWDGVRMQLNIHPRGILAWEEMVNPLCELKTLFKELCQRFFLQTQLL